jgi:hypothetical protein
MTRQFDWLLADYHDLEPTHERDTHVTTPRPSFLTTHGARFRLSRMLIGDKLDIGGHTVKRVGTDHGRVKGWRVGDLKLCYQDVLDIIEGRTQLDPPEPLVLQCPTPKPARARKPAVQRKMRRLAAEGVLPLPLEMEAA